MLNCRETTRLVSESQERPLTLKEKVGLKFHTMMCAGCRNFQKSIDSLRSAMKGFASGEYGPEQGSATGSKESPD